MKKLIFVFVSASMLFSFSGCGGKTEIVNPNDIVIESEADIEIEPESDIKIEPEPETEIKTESEPEQTESLEEIPESYVKIENGKLSGMIHPMVPVSPERENVFENELVDVSMSVPEGWEPGTLEEKGEIYGITFTMPWDNYHYASFSFYKDTGKTYDEFLANHSLWVGINEHTYHEAEGNFLKGSYIHFNYPAFDKYDHEEDAVPVYGRFYQLQFDGYVADVGVYIRIDSEENTLFDEKICDEFISSIIIG